MKQPRNPKGLFEILGLIGIILLIPLFFTMRSLAGPQTQDATATIQWLTNTPVGSKGPAVFAAATALPSASAAVVAAGKEPPACSFPLAQLATVKPKSAKYTFSQPKIVLTAAQGNVYRIAEWLPDNRQVLLAENLRNIYVDSNDNAPQQSISLFNPETGVSKRYAIRTEINELPAWQPELNAVVFPVINYTSIDKKNNVFVFTRQMWVSYGDPQKAQILANKLSQLSFAMKPDEGALLYLSDEKLAEKDNFLRDIASASFDPDQWDYARARRDERPVSFDMAWQPGTSLIFLYSDGAMRGGGYTYILNAATGRICELNLGGWAQVAHWSSDGRYLAFIRSVNYTFPTYSAELTLLDSVTGNLTTFHVTPQQAQEHYVYAFVWAPDNRHLLALASAPLSKDNPDGGNALYLIDSVSGQSSSIAPAYRFQTNSPQSMAWSPDGSKIVVACPATGAGRVCFISVQVAGQ